MVFQIHYVFVSILSFKGDNFTSRSATTTLIAVTGVTICVVVLIKWYFSGGVCRSKARLDGKIHNRLIPFKFSLQVYRFTVALILKGFYCCLMFRQDCNCDGCKHWNW